MVRFPSKSSVFSPWCSVQTPALPSSPRSRIGQDWGRGVTTAHPALGSFIVQFLARTHCPGLLHGWEREGINLPPQPKRGRLVGMRGDIRKRNMGGDGR